jgi:transposase
MSPTEELESLSREELLALVLQLQRKLSELEASVQDLRAEVDRLTRQSKRQATPFSKGARSNQPNRPGRKPGEGTFSFRQAPSPEEIIEPPVNVPVNLESCPGCDGTLTGERMDPSARLRTGFAYITDLPPLSRPKVTQYQVWVCRCTECGGQVRGQHPDLAPDQYGATAHWLGPGPWPPPMPCITRWVFRCARRLW